MEQHKMIQPGHDKMSHDYEKKIEKLLDELEAEILKIYDECNSLLKEADLLRFNKNKEETSENKDQVRALLKEVENKQKNLKTLHSFIESYEGLFFNSTKFRSGLLEWTIKCTMNLIPNLAKSFQLCSICNKKKRYEGKKICYLCYRKYYDSFKELNNETK